MTGHMTPDEFRRWGHETVEWVARYMEQVETFPVRAAVAPGEIRSRLPEHAPVEGEPFDRILGDLDGLIDGITHWQSPNFFAYFPANASGPSILGELVSAGLGVQGMLWSTSPACTEVEVVVMEWLRELCGLPERFAGNGVIQDSASSAVLCALVAARHRATRAGVDPAALQVYTSTQAHSALVKGARIVGLRDDQVTLIDVDEAFALRVDLLEAAMTHDCAAGKVPFFVMATVGTTSSSAVDPVAAIAEVAAAHRAWVHVDAAYAGAAGVCPELRWVNDGLDKVDSYEFNPHKWLLTNFDCDAFWVADRSALIDALSILPEYLRNAATESGAVIDFRDWQLPLGRRFRALKLWFVLRWYGAEGLQSFIRGHVALAQWFAAQVASDERFEVVAPVPLSLVCFRHVGGDDVNQRLLDELNASGRLFLTHTKLDGRLTLRLAIGSVTTEHRHVAAAWEAIRSAADGLGRPVN